MATYDTFAQKFAQTREQVWPDLIELIANSQVQEYLSLDIVDMGAGSGRLLDYISDRVSPEKYRGYDLSVGMISEAQKRYPNYIFEVLDMTQMGEIPPVDLVFFIASFHHLIDSSDQNICMDYLLQILNPRGRGVFLNWNLTSEKLVKRYPVDTENPDIRSIPFNGSPRFYRAWGLEELSTTLEKKGFKVLYASTTLTGANMIHIFEKV